jgi:haloalkane dehalogenase
MNPLRMSPEPVTAARGERVEVDGLPIHCVDTGDGPILLFVHGGPAWSFTWRGVIERLRDSFRCVALDLPGFGHSPAPVRRFGLRDYARALTRFIEVRDLTGATLIANDTGGPIGFRAAAALPTRFRALVAVDTFAFRLDGFASVRLMLRLTSSLPARALNRWLCFLPRAVTSFGTPLHRWRPEERAAYLAPFETPESRDRCIDLLAGLALDSAYLAELERELAGIADRPLLTLFGSGDPVRRAGFPERWARLFHDCTEHVIPGAKHFAHEDDPESVARHLRAWYAECVESQAR